MMVGTIQGVQRTTAASKDHAPLVQHRPFILPNRTRGGSFSEGQVAQQAQSKAQSCPRTAPRVQRSQEETRTSHRQWDGAGMRKQESKLSSSQRWWHFSGYPVLEP